MQLDSICLIVLLVVFVLVFIMSWFLVVLKIYLVEYHNLLSGQALMIHVGHYIRSY